MGARTSLALGVVGRHYTILLVRIRRCATRSNRIPNNLFLTAIPSADEGLGKPASLKTVGRRLRA